MMASESSLTEAKLLWVMTSVRSPKKRSTRLSQDSLKLSTHFRGTTLDLPRVRSRFSLFYRGQPSAEPHKCTNWTTSGIKNTGTVIDSGIIRPSSVTKRSTFRGASSGSPSSLDSPLNPAIARRVSSTRRVPSLASFFGRIWPRMSQRSADTLERRHWIDRVAAELLGERRLAAGVVRAALGDDGTAAGDEAHADVAVATFPQIVNGIVMGWLGRPVGGEASLGYTGSAQSRYEGREARGPDLDFVVICGGAIVQPDADLARGNSGPIGGVNRDDIVGAGGR